MMKKKIYIIVLAMMCLSELQAQIGIDEYNKYWYYRKRLSMDFIVECPPGENCIYSNSHGFDIPANSANSNNPGRDLHWGDANMYLGYYIATLATEYRILKNAGEPTDKTLENLYWAYQAFERLDKFSAINWPPHAGFAAGELNGYFIRDDVDESIMRYNPNFVKYEQGGLSIMSDKIDREGNIQYHTYGTITPDQLNALYMGFALVKKCLGKNVFYNGYDFYEKTQFLTYRTAEFLDDNDWKTRNEIGKVMDGEGHFRAEGHAWATAKAASVIDDDRDRDDFLKDTYGRKGRSLLSLSYKATVALAERGFAKDYVAHHVALGMAVGGPLRNGKDEDILYDLDRKYDQFPNRILYYYLRDIPEDLAKEKYVTELASAPCYGTQYRPTNLDSSHPYFEGVDGWRTRNRFERSRFSDGDVNVHRTNGLDYMLFYNLFVLYYGDTDPSQLSDGIASLPAGFNLDIDEDYSVNQSLYTYGSINVADAKISTNGVHSLESNEAIYLKPGTVIKASGNDEIAFRSIGLRNACGDQLDQYGDLTDDIQGMSIAVGKDLTESTRKKTAAEDSYPERKDNDYVPLDQYLDSRPTTDGSALQVSIFPNPTSDVVNILTAEEAIEEIGLYDMNGSLIRRFNSETSSIDISSYLNGIYFLKVKTARSNRTFKIIKK